ncbi:MAG: family 1 glycosylhydrolase [Candidatus Velthaea sp.]
MGPLEIWASPEPTVARVDAVTVRDQCAETGWSARADDVDRIADLGVGGCRFPVLWEHVAPDAPGVRDFRAQQAGIARLRARGVTPIVTLLHHGSGPRYTDLLDPAFPELFADYAAAAAQALPGVDRWTPINEPLTTARFATLYGVWYPNRRDDAAFGRALVHQTLATLYAMERIRAVDPAAQLVVTEDLQRFTAADAGVAAYVDFLRERGFLSIELLAGRVDAGHPLYGFLVQRCAVTPKELATIAAHAVEPALVAFNHYPHSERYVFSGADASIGDVAAVYVAGEPAPRAFGLLRAAARRLRLPLALGEVHVDAPPLERVRWLAEHVADVEALRAESVDLRAVGVWAAFGMVDWHSLLRDRAHAVEDGIYTFAGPHGVPQPTLLAAAVQALARGETIDDRGMRGWWERETRLRTPDELVTMRAAGLPEGCHVRAAGAALA